MTERLWYPMEKWSALNRGLMGGVGLGATAIFSHPLAGILLMVVFTAIGYVGARHLFRTIVHAKGFTLRGHEFEWTDVSDATVSEGKLKLNLRNGGPAELSALIVRDPAFSAAIRAWLPSTHAVARALSEQPTSA